MSFKKIAVLTSMESWFVPYAGRLVAFLRNKGYKAALFFRHNEIDKEFEIVFILSYFRIMTSKYLKKHRHNLVIHESDLPNGRGWSPLFWQILEGKNRIPIVLFEASDAADEGDIYIKDYISCKGDELHNQLRDKQAEKTIKLCLRFLNEYGKLRPRKQKGKPAFNRRRTSADSRLNINKTLKEQFNLLRIVDNKSFPAFFCYKKRKYILKIYREKEKAGDESKNVRPDGGKK